MEYDLIIIGGGPAGLTAAIYATRAKLKTLLFERKVCGGQIFEAPRVDNYPGLPHISGEEFSKNLEAQAKEFGTEIRLEEVEKFEKIEKEAAAKAESKSKSSTEGKIKGSIKNQLFKVTTDEDEYFAKAIILATGMAPRHLDIPGEDEFAGRGVSYCAVCDGNFYHNKTVAVIGGGDSALESAKYLAKICKKVYLIHRRSELRGARLTADNLREIKNIEFLLDTTLMRILGDDSVTGLEVAREGKTEQIELDGIFVAVGHVPQGAGLNPKLKHDDWNYLVADENLQSNIQGVFLAGDLRQKNLRQLTTATGDGAQAAMGAVEYLHSIAE